MKKIYNSKSKRIHRKRSKIVPAGDPPPSSRRIMLADDDVILQRAFRREAIKNGDQPIQETKGRETVNRAAAANPDVIVLDLAFADADGRDVLAQLKTDERTAHIPVVVWSSGRFDTGSDSRVVLSLGAEAYVEKSGTNLLMKKLDRVLLRLASDRAPSA